MSSMWYISYGIGHSKRKNVVFFQICGHDLWSPWVRLNESISRISIIETKTPTDRLVKIIHETPTCPTLWYASPPTEPWLRHILGPASALSSAPPPRDSRPPSPWLWWCPWVWCSFQVRAGAVYLCTNQYFDYVVMLTILVNCIFLAMTKPIDEAE